ncbi:hypothetical protein GCM10017781_24290 [Deinococcus metalli]|uniref:Bacterial bifunctional deaminase-reductase C-terminal domain-containing protein n=1 Tax=Deinococcus metalli TaxID=1141878 RepID=A0ABQ3JS10_9DEIO|nr:hypothetical protein GCM10017781_24290 [Deinococcus metalli]
MLIDITMSVDGFVTGPNDGPGNGLGDGGRALHEWVFHPTPDDLTVLVDEPQQRLGSCVLGRRTFDIAQEAWGEQPPFGASTVFVLTHRPHDTRRPARTWC